jgi:hypothetical protein
MARRSAPVYTLLLAMLLLAGCPAVKTSDGDSTTTAPSTRDTVGGGRPTSAPAAGSAAIDVTVRADPFVLTASCPAAITFTGQITVSASSRVVYRWVRSDGASARAVTLTFDEAGQQEVTTTWTLGSPGRTFKGWQAVEITSPRRVRSERANFTLTCVK